MIADRQTHRQTDTLIKIQRFAIGGGVTISEIIIQMMHGRECDIEI